MTQLNQEQNEVLYRINNGKNILITGSAGVGKSFLIDYIIERYNHKNTGLCAMTGCAAILIRGNTLHSFMGIGLAQDSVEILYKKIKSNKKLKYLDMLIIDEISMLDSALFDKINMLFQMIKSDPRPFGGLQVILVGDLFQLPPIQNNYCFLSHKWDDCAFIPFLLKTNMRQTNIDFQKLLERLRWGNCSDTDFATLSALKNTTFPDHITPTRLYPKNFDVDAINKKELEKLLDGANPAIYDKLEICEYAQVILTYNIELEVGLVNGARGYVKDYTNSAISVKFQNGLERWITYITIKNRDGKENTFIPLKLAWALSIHKSQGMTIDALEVDLGSNIFTYGQAYTALSRSKDMNSIKIINLSKSAFRVSPAVVDFYSNM